MNEKRDWAQNDSVVKKLVRFALKLETKHQDEKVLSLGQSFSWPVYTLGKIRERRGEDPNNGFIPFSGSLYELDELRYTIAHFEQMIMEEKPGMFRRAFNTLTGQKAGYYTDPDAHWNMRYYNRYPEEYQPNEDDIQNFFSSLTEYRADAKTLIDHHRKTGQRTAILEKACMGDGFYTFLSLWVAHAKEQGAEEEIKNAAYFIVYSLNAGMLKPETTNLSDRPVGIRYPIELIEPNDRDVDFIQAISRDNSLDSESTRLVDLYNINSRGIDQTPRPERADNADKLSFIKDRIDFFLDKEMG